MNISNKFHGIGSIVLLDLGTIIAIYSIALEHIAIALMYTALVIVIFGLIIYIFCRKCLSRKNCSHVILGKVTQIMPKPKVFKYTNRDYAYTGILLLVFIAFPQYWLWKLAAAPYLYWALLAIAALQINKFVCPTCNNTNCAMCKKKLLNQQIHN